MWRMRTTLGKVPLASTVNFFLREALPLGVISITVTSDGHLLATFLFKSKDGIESAAEMQEKRLKVDLIVHKF